MRRVVSQYIRDILDAMDKIERFTEGMDFENFKSDDKTLYAVLRALELIGEAAKNVPEEIRNEYPEIPWKSIIGMRNKIIHVYFGVNEKIVWRTINSDIPRLRPLFEEILGELEKNENSR